MKNSQKIIRLILVVFISFTIKSCAQESKKQFSENRDTIIATKNGFNLTEAHFKIYLEFVENYAGETADSKTQIGIKAQLKETFLKMPKALLQKIEELQSTTNPSKTNATKLLKVETTQNNQKNNIAEGHNLIRKLLGKDIGQMQFDTKKANSFRTFMANTLLTTSSSSSTRGYDNTSYSASSGSIQFCSNGTFVQVLSGQLSIGTKGLDVSSSDGDSYMPGYWEVAALPNGTTVILMYSTHPSMLEDFPNGLVPWIVPKYGNDFVSLPNGELYKRTINQYCN